MVSALFDIEDLDKLHEEWGKLLIQRGPKDAVEQLGVEFDAIIKHARGAYEAIDNTSEVTEEVADALLGLAFAAISFGIYVGYEAAYAR